MPGILIPKLGWPDSNRQLLESKSSALPLGYIPLSLRCCSCSNWHRIIFAIFVRSCRIPCPWLNNSHSSIFSQNWHSSFMSFPCTRIIHHPPSGDSQGKYRSLQDIVLSIFPRSFSKFHPNPNQRIHTALPSTRLHPLLLSSRA
jgi:hypothetical protein